MLRGDLVRAELLNLEAPPQAPGPWFVAGAELSGPKLQGMYGRNMAPVFEGKMKLGDDLFNQESGIYVVRSNCLPSWGEPRQALVLLIPSVQVQRVEIGVVSLWPHVAKSPLATTAS